MVKGKNVKRFRMKLDCGIKMPCLLKDEEKGNRIVVCTDRNVNAVVRYFDRRIDHHFESAVFKEHVFKRLKLRPTYKVVVEYGDGLPASEAETIAMSRLRKKVNDAVRRRLDYVSDILMEIHNSLQ